jgi:hypothetical protein
MTDLLNMLQHERAALARKLAGVDAAKMPRSQR